MMSVIGNGVADEKVNIWLPKSEVGLEYRSFRLGSYFPQFLLKNLLPTEGWMPIRP